MKCRTFKEKYVWSEKMFFIPENISFEELKNNSFTAHLNKNNYLCTSNFEDDFLNKLIKKYINSKIYYHI
jgi:hypothetical protein